MVFQALFLTKKSAPTAATAATAMTATIQMGKPPPFSLREAVDMGYDMVSGLILFFRGFAGICWMGACINPSEGHPSAGILTLATYVI